MEIAQTLQLMQRSWNSWVKTVFVEVSNDGWPEHQNKDRPSDLGVRVRERTKINISYDNNVQGYSHGHPEQVKGKDSVECRWIHIA